MEYARLIPGPGYSPLQSILYYGQRLVTSPFLREKVIAMLRAGVRHRHGEFISDAQRTDGELSDFHALRSCGYAPLGILLTEEQISDIHSFFRCKLLTSRHDRSASFTFNDVPAGVRVADYSLADILESPHIMELANRPALLRLAADYIGCKPTISAIGLRWSFPAHSKGTDVQAFHRDSDDWKYMKVLVYLTDVDEGTGPHVYVKGTHLSRAPLRLRFHSDEEILREYGPERLVTATGKAGFGFAVDTSGIHKGSVPLEAPRLMLQIQYSLLPAFAYRYQPQPYNGLSAIDPYINRMMCTPSASSCKRGG